MTVADASVLVDALSAPAGAAGHALARAEQPLAAPHVVDLEIISACRSQLVARTLSQAQVEAVLLKLNELPLQRYGHQALLPRIWELRHQVTPYDAVYVALAEQLSAVLLTADTRLARAHGLRCEVQLIGA